MRLTKNNYQDDLFELQATKKVKVDKYTEIGYSQANYNDDLWNKVKNVEDIEKELGIDLITLFKASKKIVIKNDDESLEEIEHYVEDGCGLTNYVFDLDSKVIMFTCYGYELNGLILDFKDYGKTWASTKEELEDD